MNMIYHSNKILIVSYSRLLQWRVEELMAYRGDYPNYFVKPTILGKYLRYNVADTDYIFDIQGDSQTTKVHGSLEK